MPSAGENSRLRDLKKNNPATRLTANSNVASKRVKPIGTLCNNTQLNKPDKARKIKATTTDIIISIKLILLRPGMLVIFWILYRTISSIPSDNHIASLKGTGKANVKSQAANKAGSAKPMMFESNRSRKPNNRLIVDNISSYQSNVISRPKAEKSLERNK